MSNELGLNIYKIGDIILCAKDETDAKICFNQLQLMYLQDMRKPQYKEENDKEDWTSVISYFPDDTPRLIGTTVKGISSGPLMSGEIIRKILESGEF